MNRQGNVLVTPNVSALPTLTESDGGGVRLVAIVTASVILVPIALLGPNTTLAIYAWLTLVIGIASLWRQGEPPILMLVFGYQWLQAAIALFYGNLLGVSAASWTEHGGQHETAILLLLNGLNVLALSIRAGAGRLNVGLSDRLRSLVSAHPQKTWFMVYAFTWVFSQACLWGTSLSAGLYQPLLFLSQIKWAGFFLVTLSTFSMPGQPKMLWLVAFIVELATSVGGYFSSFSDIFFYTLVSIAACRVRLGARTLFPLIIVGSVMLVFGIVWSGVKKEYRQYVSAGLDAQVVTIGYTERIQKLTELVSEMDGAAMGKATDTLISRMMYFEFFGLVLDRVPSGTPHTGGELWGQALTLPFTPRLLFPDKPKIDDTELTSRFTGIHAAAWSNDVSISMGYMAEAYIDFGPVLMYVAIAALGLAMGGIYRWLLSQPGERLIIGAALAPVALMNFHALESSIFKMLPPLVLSVIGCWFILTFLGPRLFTFLAKQTAASRSKALRKAQRMLRV